MKVKFSFTQNVDISLGQFSSMCWFKYLVQVSCFLDVCGKRKTCWRATQLKENGLFDKKHMQFLLAAQWLEWVSQTSQTAKERGWKVGFHVTGKSEVCNDKPAGQPFSTCIKLAVVQNMFVFSNRTETCKIFNRMLIGIFPSVAFTILFVYPQHILKERYLLPSIICLLLSLERCKLVCIAWDVSELCWHTADTSFGFSYMLPALIMIIQLPSYNMMKENTVLTE